MKEDRKIFNNPKGSVSNKQATTDTDIMVMCEKIECTICMVTYVQMTNQNQTEIKMCIETVEGIT